MTTVASYTEARANLSSLIDRVLDDRETVVIRRRGSASVVLIAEDELRGLQEAAHLLRSPANAQRLMEGLRQAEAGEGREMTVSEVRAEVGLAPKPPRR